MTNNKKFIEEYLEQAFTASDKSILLALPATLELFFKQLSPEQIITSIGDLARQNKL